MIKRAIIVGPELDRRRRRRPADAARAGRQALAEDAGLRRGVPRRRVDDRPRGRPDQPLRAPRHRALGGAAEGGREALHAPGAAPRPVRRGRRRSPTRRARARATPTTLLADARHRRDPRARLPHRRRLRLLGRVARAAARARAARRGGDHGARVRVRRRVGRGAAAGDDRARRSASSSAVERRPRRRLRPLGGAALPDRRAGAGGPARPGAAPLPAPARRPGAAARSSCR